MRKGGKKKSLLKLRSKKVGFFADKNNTIFIVIFGFVVLCGLLIICRLYYVQVLSGDQYRTKIDRQHKGFLSNDELVRGNIYLSYKDGSRILAATNKEYYSLVINNRNITSAENVRKKLHTVVSFDDAVFDSIVAKKNDPYEILLKRIKDEEAQAIRDMSLSGVELHVNEERFYPLGDLASAIVGFVSYQNEKWRGTYGLEKYYDNILRRDGDTDRYSIFSYLFGDGVVEADESSIEKHIAKEGSLVTTIEPNVQEYLELRLQQVTKQWKSKYTAGIIMDPDSGEVIAMVSGNEFDVNKGSKHYRNHIVEDRYEFGSIMKPLTVAMALDNDSISRDFSYNDKGSMTMDRYTFYNYDKRGRGPHTNLQTVLTQSLNTGVAVIALRMGFDVFEDYLQKLGLDSETGIDLPFEVYGIVSNLESRRKVELATASFGQGVAFTAMEMAQAWTALAGDDGAIKTPYVVDTIEYGDLIPAKNKPPRWGDQVFSDVSRESVTQMLVNLVDKSDTFKSYSLKQHSVALKTGTAQMANPRGGYYEKQFLHSMTGYFPTMAKPGEKKFLLMIFTIRPQGVRYSSTTLKDPFFDTVKYLVRYYDINPDRNINEFDNMVIE